MYDHIKIFLSWFWPISKCSASLKARIGDCYSNCCEAIEDQIHQGENFNYLYNSSGGRHCVSPRSIFFIKHRFRLSLQSGLVFPDHVLEELDGCGERVIFADAFSHSLQAPGLLVDGDADGFLPGGAWNGSYFPATGFPLRNVEEVAVAHPGQGVRYLMQDRGPGFMGIPRLLGQS